MTQALTFLVSLSPFAVFIYLLLKKNLALAKTSFVTLGLTLALAFFYWRIVPQAAFVSLGKGFFVAFDIFVILGGAIFFLEILKRFGVIEAVSYYLESFSKDHRIQVILLAWFLENFIEGTAGFGTPSAIVAPLLVGLGLAPLNAAIVSLFGNSSSVVFGAAGTPIRIGFFGLESSSVPFYAAMINIVGLIVPLFMLWTVVSHRQDRKKLFWEAVPFAIWSGLAFVLPSILVVPLGQEFPSIIGAIIGVLLVFVSTKLGIFVPKNAMTVRPEEKLQTKLSLRKTVFPYGLLVLLLVLGKIFLSGISFKIPLINHSISAFNPGLAFILAGILVVAAWRKTEKLVLRTAVFSLRQAVGPFLVIIAMSAMVQLMINSGQNFSSLPSLIAIVAKTFETSWLPFFSPFVGAFGSFLTGSATISNLLFGGFLAQAAFELSMNSQIILALALVGGAAGNMIALADMLAAETVVGLKNKEAEIIKKIFVPCLIYVLLAGIIGMVIV
ncbi:MAG: L-lactate transport [Parcubacteria group bacterium GW2011_GWA1_Parcubacteria_45_10]|nr:MAG: L-lactate transport [Parcubacteria group bacterium GW2011_GWA1_Parcubacteria_45_10]